MKRVFLFLGLLFLAGCTQPETSLPEREIRLEIIVKDQVNETVLFEGTRAEKGQIQTLYDFLKEADDLDVKLSQGMYGAYIDSILGLEQNFDRGPWWLYTSSNNETCLKEGICPAIQELDIEDGDRFEFTYTKNF